MTPIRVLVVDDHPIVRQGVRSLLSNYPDMALAGEADSAEAALALAGAAQPDVILLDIRMPPGPNGVELLGRLRQACPAARILMLTSFDDDEYVTGALQAGAAGYLLKSASDETLVSAVRAVYRGESVLSPAVLDRVVQQLADHGAERPERPAGLSDDERAILRRLAEGASNSKIAADLYLSETTVKRKLQEIFDVLGVTSRAQAAAEAVRRGLI